MNLSPETLMEETETERRERERRTGVLKTGHLVECFPVPEDPEVVQIQHRAVCLVRPHAACTTCPHSTFTLAFDANKKTERLSLVSCPRWATPQGQIIEGAPDHYVPVEQATCEAKPFLFCASCPSKREVELCGADKTKEGWHGRWKRLQVENEE